ncbi:hypothetical protein N2152v2_000580 [Parachlorella kessleri]
MHGLGAPVPSSLQALLLVYILFLSAITAARHNVKTVHLVFSCHLDIGFAGIEPEVGLDSNVINKYFHEYFPKAVTVAQELRSRGGPEQLKFLTNVFEEAVQRGDITWHAFPHNAQLELFDPGLLEYAVQLTHGLDERFGLPRKLTMSQRDVPGFTRAAIPILYSQGVRAVSVGVNGGSAPPGVPKNTPFWWRDEASGKQLLAFWHPGGYSGWPVDSRKECVKVKGFDRALCTSWRGDNAGPPSVDEVLDVFRQVQHQFPGAEVVASTFDEFVEPLLEAAPSLNLPVVTGEIGDTWIHGVGSDPGRLAEFRTLLRLRRENVDLADGLAFQKFSRLLLKVPEHTWGVDVKKALGDYDNWSNKDFHAQLANKSDNYQVTVASWVRQRAYGLWAAQELGESTLGLKAWTALASLQNSKHPPAPSEPRFKRANLSQPLRFFSDAWGIELDECTGAIVGLQPLAGNAPVGRNAARQQQQQQQSLYAAAADLAAGSGGRQAGTGGMTSSSSSDGLWRSIRCSGSSGRLARWLSWVLRVLGWAGEGLCEPHGVQAANVGGGAKETAVDLASRENPLALVVYSTYAEDDYSTIWDTYSYMNELADWFYKDFGKPNSTVKGAAKRADYQPRLKAVWHRETAGGGFHLVTKAAFPRALVKEAGAPRAVWTEIRSPPNSSDLLVDVIWENKTATRLPEALWVRWRPSLDSVDPTSWVLHKLGQPISPLEVILNGSHALHAVGDEGVSVRTTGSKSWLSVRSLDAALVSPGSPTPFQVLSSPPDLKQGVSFALTNNIWGTNYAM